MPSIAKRITNTLKARKLKELFQSEFNHTHYKDADSFYSATESSLTSVPKHSETSYSQAHDLLIKHLNSVGKATESCDEVADFYLDRQVGESTPIGVVAEYNSITTLCAIAEAQKQFTAAYAVNLDCDHCQITIKLNGECVTYSDDLSGDLELQHYGFTKLR